MKSAIKPLIKKLKKEENHLELILENSEDSIARLENVFNKFYPDFKIADYRKYNGEKWIDDLYESARELKFLIVIKGEELRLKLDAKKDFIKQFLNELENFFDWAEPIEMESFSTRDEQRKHKYEMKPDFKERMQKLMPDKADFEAFEKIVHTGPKNFIRCNTLKIKPEALLERLNKKWKVIQPYSEYPEIMLITQELMPGELGNSIEHLLGYYYVQEICSMMSVLALEPKPGEFVLDLCASPGSKTSQMAAKMENQGTLIANDLKMDRVKILSANLEKNGVSNAILTQKDAVAFTSHIKDSQLRFDKILLDAPCSGEGTLRSSPKTFLMWNEKIVYKLSRLQKKFIAQALKCLKVGGTLVYSTCTHGPEEDEEVVDFALKNFPVKVEKINLPLKCRPGLTSWDNKKYNKEVEKSCRIYPQDNDSEGFFVCKMTLVDEIKPVKGELI